MYCLEVIKSPSYQNPPKIRDNFNRDSSFNKSRNGIVIHSAIHRSTSFISKDEFPDSYESAEYWLGQGQRAVNTYVPSLISGSSLQGASEMTVRALLPNWQIVTPHGHGNQGNAHVRAIKNGGIPTIVSARDWRELWEKCRA